MTSKATTPELAAALDAVPLEDVVRRRVQLLLSRLSDGRVEGLYPVIMREVERALISTVLAQTSGHKEQAARILGLHRNTLRLRLNALGLGGAAKATK